MEAKRSRKPDRAVYVPRGQRRGDVERLTTAERIRRNSKDLRAKEGSSEAEVWELYSDEPWAGESEGGDGKARRSLGALMGRPPVEKSARTPSLPLPEPSDTLQPKHPSQVIAEMLRRSRGQKGSVASSVSSVAEVASSSSTSHNSPSPSQPRSSEDILDCLPTSLDAFESAERDLSIQRRLSSPLLSPATPRQSFSPLLAAQELEEESMELTPPDMEDLEVAAINDSYEEAQKQRRLYESGGLKEAFYSRASPGAYDNVRAASPLASNVEALAQLSQLPAEDWEADVFPSTSAALPPPPPAPPTVRADRTTPTMSWAGWGGGSPLPPEDPSASLLPSPPLSSQPEGDWRDDGAALAYLDALATDILASVLEEEEDLHDQVEWSLEDDPRMEALLEQLVSGALASALEGLVPKAEDRDSGAASEADSGGESSSSSPASQKDEYELMASAASVAATSATEEEANNNEGESWEDLCDDEGTILDDKLLDDISAALDKVKIQERRSKRTSQSSQALPPSPPPDEDDDAAPSPIVEAVFPVGTRQELVSQGLLSLRCGEFRLRPLSDTSALVIFDSPKLALDALAAASNPLFVLRSLARASAEAREAAEKEVRDSATRVVRRPERSAALARRLVEGHLGQRSQLSAEARKEEKDRLGKAKEAKKEAAKAKKDAVRKAEEAWEGSL